MQHWAPEPEQQLQAIHNAATEPSTAPEPSTQRLLSKRLRLLSHAPCSLVAQRSSASWLPSQGCNRRVAARSSGPRMLASSLDSQSYVYGRSLLSHSNHYCYLRVATMFACQARYAHLGPHAWLGKRAILRRPPGGRPCDARSNRTPRSRRRLGAYAGRGGSV